MSVTLQGDAVAPPFCWCDGQSGDSCVCVIKDARYIIFSRCAPRSKAALEGCIAIEAFLGIKVSGTQVLRIELVCSVVTKIRPTVQRILLGECGGDMRTVLLEHAARFEEAVRFIHRSAA